MNREWISFLHHDMGNGYYYETYGNGYTEFFVYSNGTYDSNGEYNNSMIWNYQNGK